jgi:hypothetical protein
MLTSTVFLVALLIISIGSMTENVYIIGFGAVVTGFSDCSCFVLGLSLAGIWKEKGVAIFNISQSLTVAVTVMIMIFVPYYAAILWICGFYLWNLIGLFLYRKKL